MLSDYIELKSGGNYNSNGAWNEAIDREAFKYYVHSANKLRITSWTGGNVPECVFFDKSGGFVSYINNADAWANKEHEYDVPTNAYYMWTATTDAGIYYPVVYLYDFDKSFSSKEILNEVNTSLEKIDKSIDDIYKSSDITNDDLDKVNKSVFGEKTNTILTPLNYGENQIYNSNGDLESYDSAFYKYYRIKGISNLIFKNWAGGYIPLAVFFNNKKEFISSFTPTTGWTGSYLTLDIPKDTVYVALNISDSIDNADVKGDIYDTSYNVKSELERIENSIPESNVYDLEQAQLQLAKTQRMNDFAYSQFDKAYFVLTIDDANQYLPVIYDLCHELGIPLCPAIIPSNLNISYDGRTVKEICDLVVADGGEILSHSGKYINADSTEQDYVDVFRETKRILENNGYTIRGIITAGGVGYSSYTKKLDDWSRRYYDYSDQNGLKTSPAYSHTRWWHADYTMDGAKNYVDNAIANKSFVVMAMHGSSDTESLEYVDHVRELLEYMVSKGATFTTWAYVYDTFKSTKLEEHIKALENN